LDFFECARKRFDAFEQIIHALWRRALREMIEGDGFGNFFAARDGFAFEIASRLLAQARRGGGEREREDRHQGEQGDERVAALARARVAVAGLRRCRRSRRSRSRNGWPSMFNPEAHHRRGCRCRLPSRA
jgi:hypothetical protein